MKQKLHLRFAFFLRRTLVCVAAMTLCGFSLQAQTQTRLTVTDFHFDQSKPYDGTTDVVRDNSVTILGVAPNDNVTAVSRAHYNDSAVGTNKTITIDFVLVGSDANKYVLDTVITFNYGIITRRQLEVTTTLQGPYTYTGDTLTTLFSWTVDNRVTGENVFLSGMGVFENPNVGERRSLTIYYSLFNGTDTGNYLAPLPQTFETTIVPKAINMTGTLIDPTKVYDGTTLSHVSYHGLPVGVVGGDDVMPIEAVANYSDPLPGTGKPVTVTYTLNGPQAYNYTVNPVSMTAAITPRPLTYKNLNIATCNEEDGTDTAYVLNRAEGANVVEGDNVKIVTTAKYNDNTVAHNKTITCTISFDPAGVDNYKYTAPAPFVYSLDGKIIRPTDLTLYADGSAFQMSSDGACQGENAYLSYSIAEGEPKWYSIDYSTEALAQGFVNVVRDLLPTDGSNLIELVVPAGCAEGSYTATISLINEAAGSTPMTYLYTFKVNYPKTLVEKLFDDVVCINNTGDRFTSYQWYHDGSPIAGATKQYYQQPGGLTGVYYCRLNDGKATEGRTCERDFGTPSPAAKAVAVTPNPVMTVASVKLQGFDNTTHTLQLFNAYGVKVLDVQFTGVDFNLDLSQYPQGLYMVYVDGVSAKAIKY